jgi:EamA-like transporter family.
MVYFLLFVVIFLSIVIWPVSRWAMKKNAQMENMGMIISFTVVIFSLGMLFIEKKPFFEPTAAITGSLMGVSYAVGFCIVIFYCLKIGPSGPAVTMNNLGCVWPVLISIIFYSQGKMPKLAVIVGIAAIFTCLILMIFNKSNVEENKKSSSKWVKLLFIGWFFSGISFSCQFFASQYSPDYSLTFIIFGYGVSFVILFSIYLFKHAGKPRREEVIAGVVSGIVNVLMFQFMFYILRYIPAYIYYPLTQTVAILFMLLVGNFLLGEKMNKFGWTASLLGVAGIILLNMPG